MENPEEFINKFEESDKSDIPDFDKCNKPLDMALWVLWVVKNKLGVKRLTAEQISLIIVETQETSVNANSITNSLKRAADKIYRHCKNGDVYYEIMRPGKEHVFSLGKKDLVNAFYFEPDSKFTAKKFLKNQIFTCLKGNLRIVDPYCAERTLDILESIKGRPVKFLTRIENLRDRERSRFIRELTDFKSENANAEFRNYPHSDIHDRYIISEREVSLIGHSFKDFGAKETFTIILERQNNRDIYDALSTNFDNRWSISTAI